MINGGRFMKKLSLVCFCALIVLMTTEAFAQGQLIWNGKTILVHRTVHEPGATTAFGRIWISFAGDNSDRTVNVLSSANGFTFDGGPGPIIGKRSRYGVRLASQCGNLYVAYVGQDSDSSVGVTMSPNAGATWPSEVVIGNADTSPTITAFGSNLGVAWGNILFLDEILQAEARVVGCNLTTASNLFCLFPNPFNLFCPDSPNAPPFPAEMTGSPAWDAGDARGFSRVSGQPMQFKFGPLGGQSDFFGNHSTSGPFLVNNPATGHHYVTWIGGGNRINVANLNTNVHLVSADSSQNTPALAVFNNQLFVVWRGGDNRINVASTNLF
jgi:hypothetical protein